MYQRRGQNGKVKFRITSQGCKPSRISKADEEGGKNKGPVAATRAPVFRQEEDMDLPGQRWGKEKSWDSRKKDSVQMREHSSLALKPYTPPIYHMYVTHIPYHTYV